jgi:hypothetical protein
MQSGFKVGTIEILGDGFTVTVLVADCCSPQLSVTVQYTVAVPAVGKFIVGLFPVPAEGVPLAFRLQLTEYGDTPYTAPLNVAVRFCPAHTVFDEIVNGVVVF